MDVLPIFSQAGLKPSSLGLAAAVILVLDIAVIFAVLFGKGSVRHKILWTVAVLVLPILGLVLYFAIGHSRADRTLME